MNILDVVDAFDVLQQFKYLREVYGPAERPPLTIRSATRKRTEILLQFLDSFASHLCKGYSRVRVDRGTNRQPQVVRPDNMQSRGEKSHRLKQVLNVY